MRSKPVRIFANLLVCKGMDTNETAEKPWSVDAISKLSTLISIHSSFPFISEIIFYSLRYLHKVLVT
jgi:hypothetical protein